MEKITVQAIINKPIENVWDAYYLPEHVTHWNFASDTWHCPMASNDFVVGGKFNYRMEAKDGSMGFDFIGIYDEIIDHQKMVYHMPDNREVIVLFYAKGMSTHVEVHFDAEQENSIDLQKMGWQAILSQFKTYVETLS
jgi:uncharacterized protein YndB with AHSA1/START domain